MKSRKKVIAFILISVMILGLGMAGNGLETTFAQEKEIDYIIVTKNKKAIKGIESKYHHILEEEKQKTKNRFA